MALRSEGVIWWPLWRWSSSMKVVIPLLWRWPVNV